MHVETAPWGVRIAFDKRPPDKVLALLKARGFRWNRATQSWLRRKVTGAADVVAGIRKLTEPRAPDGKCWDCGSPEGYFRSRGAATPVWCDRCAAENSPQP